MFTFIPFVKAATAEVAFIDIEVFVVFSLEKVAFVVKVSFSVEFSVCSSLVVVFSVEANVSESTQLKIEINMSFLVK